MAQISAHWRIKGGARSSFWTLADLCPTVGRTHCDRADVANTSFSCYPDVHLDLLVGSEPSIDIVASGLDAGLAVRERVPVEMTAIRASAPMRAAVVASPGLSRKARGAQHTRRPIIAPVRPVS